MRTELHADAHSHHQVDQRHSIEGDVPPVHEAAEVDNDEDNDQEVDDAGHEVKTHENEGYNEDCSERNSQRFQSVVPHCQVLFIEDIEDGVGEDVDMMFWISSVVDELHHTVRQLSGSGQGHEVVFTGLQYRVERHEVARPHLHQTILSWTQLH